MPKKKKNVWNFVKIGASAYGDKSDESGKYISRANYVIDGEVSNLGGLPVPLWDKRLNIKNPAKFEDWLQRNKGFQPRTNQERIMDETISAAHNKYTFEKKAATKKGGEYKKSVHEAMYKYHKKRDNIKLAEYHRKKAGVNKTGKQGHNLRGDATGSDGHKGRHMRDKK